MEPPKLIFIIALAQNLIAFKDPVCLDLSDKYLSGHLLETSGPQQLIFKRTKLVYS